MTSGAPISNQRLIVDQWSYLGHKEAVGDFDQTVQRTDWLPSWVPASERRRLNAYRLYDQYRRNRAARSLRNASEQQIRDHREYGDASLITSRIAHGVLGDDWEVVVDGADDDLSEGPDLPDPPEDPGPDATPGQRRVFQILEKRHAEDEAAAIDEWEQSFSTQPRLAAVQEQLREWADREQLAGKLTEREDDAVTLGDAVLALSPRGEGEWPELLVYQPDAYFPILGDRPGEVTKLHMAWGFEETQPNGTVKEFVRRLTWELVDLVLDDGTDQALAAGAEPGARPVPWSDEPVTRTCVFSEGVWSLDRVGPNGIPDLSDAAAVWETDEQGEVRNRDLRCDFIPVYHTPNTPAARTHFGTSCLGVIAQVLDDLGQADTDLMETARLVSSPAIALSGALMPSTTDAYGNESKALRTAPGEVFELGETGQMTVLDLSVGLEKMMAFRDGVRDRALVNGHVTKTLVGWTASDSAPSGIALLIDAAPFGQLIGSLRMTREVTDRSLLEDNQKLAMISGVLEPGPVAPARVAYGNFLPLDRTQVVAEVTQLYAAKMITLETGIQLLMAAGFAIENAREEAERIRLADVERAKGIADATGNDAEGAKALGLEPPEQPKPPDIQLPPPPGENQPPEPPPQQ